ncbi:AtpZ/AtpI family protein [Desulforamulus putei]|uniref:Putative F0F1-ATPase subunit Ca2+/Mg2+ transporter n=1 Tax=Desulforamulus putei DSM 12395 TaxID=1121429 RepID=A0A1M4XUL0_9FIRM|nr:AtpZ/AtpI family protein [Desulforamulus putei]SHE96963.1 Putative F0F1-ATPase subunit Ca2+/Mg2+ transporter [Desulforamulus putei DSM 12395]
MSGKGKGDPLRALALASSISVEIAAATVAGFMGGRWLDSKLDTAPWFMLAGLLLGMAGGMWGVYHTLETFRKKDKG